MRKKDQVRAMSEIDEAAEKAVIHNGGMYRIEVGKHKRSNDFLLWVISGKKGAQRRKYLGSRMHFGRAVEQAIITSIAIEGVIDDVFEELVG